MKADHPGNENVYRILAEYMLDMVSQHDPDGRILWISPSVTNLLGYDPEELVGTVFYDLFQEDDRQYMLRYAHNLTLTEGYNPNLRIEYRIRKKKGGYLWFESMTNPIRNDHNEIVRLQITSRDITKRRRAEKALDISKKRQELALEGADLGLWDLNLRSGHLVVNERWAEMLGYNVNEIEPSLQGWSKLIHPDDWTQMNNALRDHLQGKTTTLEIEYRMRTKEGHYLWILSRGKVLDWDDTNKPYRAIGTHLDITQNKRIETAVMKAVVDAEENERQRFAKDLHDGIGQYLTAIRMMLEAIKENIDNEEYGSCGALINVANSHIDNTVKDLREISHNLMPGSLKDLGLVIALEEMFDDLLAPTPIRLDFESNFKTEKRLEKNTEVHVYRICQQLLSNTLQHAAAKNIRLHLNLEPEALILSYADDGSGLPSEDVKQFRGNGLRNIGSRVKSLNGTIHFEETAGFSTNIIIPVGDNKQSVQ